MRVTALAAITVAVLAGVLVAPARAEVVYTQVNASIPVQTSYNIDLQQNGVTNYTLTSKLIQAYCQNGDEFNWTLSVTPAGQNGVVIDATHTGGSNWATPLPSGVEVNSSQPFYTSFSILAGLYWGACETGSLGEWLGLSGRYLGLQFQGSDGQIHYGWAEVATSAYVDQNGNLHTSTTLFGFAYETVAGQGILTGQTSGPSQAAKR